jgi:hypothetical protein
MILIVALVVQWLLARQARAALYGLLVSCAHCSNSYLSDGVLTPTYRLPERDLRLALCCWRWLAWPSWRSVHLLQLFAVEVAAFNRALDVVAETRTPLDASRCRLKAGNIALRRFQPCEAALFNSQAPWQRG